MISTCRAKLTLLVAAVALAGALAGCNVFQKGNSATATLIPAANSPIADVPVPAAFSLVAEKSWSNWNPTLKLRTLSHEYTGKDAMLAVVRFYRDQLPTNKWAEPVLDQQGKKVTLRSNKQGEDLVITIWEGTFDTHINIKLDPTGRNTPR